MTRWPTAYPRHRGHWTLFGHDGRWGSLDPETLTTRVAPPDDDPELPALRAVSDRGDLIGYRVGRRAVVRGRETFVKVVRPRRLSALIRAHETAADASTALLFPEVLDAGSSGWVELSRMPGLSLHQALRAVTPDPAEVDHISAIGRALAGFHSATPPPDVARRSFDEPTGWIETVGRVEPQARAGLARVARDLPSLAPGGEVLVHGDLHDKNVFISPDGIGLIDLDGLGFGAAEDDIANLAVHLRLRALQAGDDTRVGDERAEGLYAAYRSVRPLDPARVEAVERHTWFRLACIYRFRAASRHLVPELLRRAGVSRCLTTTSVVRS